MAHLFASGVGRLAHFSMGMMCGLAPLCARHVICMVNSWAICGSGVAHSSAS